MRCPGSLHPGLGLRTEGALRRPWKRTVPHRRLCRHCRGCCNRRHLTVWVCGSRQRKQNSTGSCKWSQIVSSKKHNSTSQPYIGFFGLFGVFLGGECGFFLFVFFCIEVHFCSTKTLPIFIMIETDCIPSWLIFQTMSCPILCFSTPFLSFFDSVLRFDTVSVSVSR